MQREIDSANGFLLDTYCLVCQESTTAAVVEGRRGTAVVCKYTHAAVSGRGGSSQIRHRQHSPLSSHVGWGVGGGGWCRLGTCR